MIYDLESNAGAKARRDIHGRRSYYGVHDTLGGFQALDGDVGTGLERNGMGWSEIQAGVPGRRRDGNLTLFGLLSD